MVRVFRYWFILLVLTAPYSVTLAKTPEIELNLSKSNVWQREQVIATLVVISKDKLARLEAEDFEQDGFTIIPLDKSREEKNNEVRITLKWLLFPYIADEKRLEFPRIRFRPSSSRPIELNLPELFIRVQALPIYVPPTMPVGQVSLEQSWDHGFIISAKKLFNWTFTAHSQQVSPRTLPGISRQLTSNEHIQILPTQKQINETVSEKSVAVSQHYEIPLKALRMGQLKFPTIAIQYFDPSDSTLKKETIKTPTVFVFYSWMLWIGFLLCAVLLLWAIIKLYPKVSAWHQKRTTKQQALSALKAARNYDQIRQSLNNIALAEGREGNHSLAQFSIAYQDKPAHSSIKSLMESLNAIRFSKNNDSFENIALSLYRILSKVK